MGGKSGMIPVPFTKMSGTGNDFIMVNNSKARLGVDWPSFARRFCTLKTGIGADGVIVLDTDAQTDFSFRIFNADGSEAEMCGNGARCAARFAHDEGLAGLTMSFRTLAGIIGAKVGPEDVSIRMTDPSGLRTGIALGLGDADLSVHFINTGVPHTIVFTDDVKDVSVSEMGRAIRFHESFTPEGTNVNFVQVLGEDHIHVRTYERGVEAETYACGTGAVASAVMAHHLGMTPRKPVNVRTRGGKLMIDFATKGSSYSDVWLMGPADTVFTGEVLVGQ